MSDPVRLSDEVRELLDGPNYVHLSTIRSDGTPRNWVVWTATQGDRILVCTGEASWKARDMLRNPAVALSVTDFANPYRMAAVQGRVVEVRDDAAGSRLPVLLVLGGHRTGRDSVDLFGEVADVAVVGIEYPYDGPEKVRGTWQILNTLPQAPCRVLPGAPAVG